MKTKFKVLQSLLFIIPFVIEIIACIKSSFILSLISIIMMFAFTICLPICRGRENLLIFIETGIVTIPLNIKFITYSVEEFGYGYSSFTLIIIATITFFILLSIEEIVIGIFTRVIRPNQIDFED